MSDGWWMDAKFDSRCGECNRTIREGDRIVYLPKERTALCSNPDCGPARIGEDPEKDR